MLLILRRILIGAKIPTRVGDRGHIMAIMQDMQITPRQTTPAIGKWASASQYMECLYSGTGKQGKGKGGKGNPATHTVAPSKLL